MIVGVCDLGSNYVLVIYCFCYIKIKFGSEV